MTARPADIDPPELQERLWAGFTGDIAYDVGANYGQSIGRILVAFFRAVAFEPSPEPYRALSAQWASETVRCINLAVSDHTGTLQAVELDDGQYAFPGTHGIKGLEGDRVRGANCRTLDSAAPVYGVPDLVKVDTEGHEVEVLLGARGLLRDFPPDWLIEFHNPENLERCQDILAGHRYELEVVRHPHYPVGSDNWQGHGWLRALAPSIKTA